MAQTLTLIEDALRLTGVLEDEESATGPMGLNGLNLLNQMLDGWSLKGINIPYVLKQSITWPGNTASQTVGPTGNSVPTVARPIKIETLYAQGPGNLDYPVTQIGNDEYQRILNKTITSSIPEVFYYDAQMPNGEIFLYPIPAASMTVRIFSWAQFANLPLLTTEMTLAPAYYRAIKYNLAVELALNYRRQIMPNHQQIANTSLGEIRDTNTKDFVMQLDPVFYDMSNGYNTVDGRFNIFRGW